MSLKCTRLFLCSSTGYLIVSSTVTALLAVWKAGAAYVPMEPSFPQARITHILSDAEPALLIYDDSGKFPHIFQNI